MSTITGLNILDEYLKWIKDNTKIHGISNNDAITTVITPFLDRHNDCIEIYIMAGIDGKIILSDGGYIINDLEMSGFEYDSSEKRKQTVMTILNGFGVKIKDGASLFVEANPNNIGEKKHSLIQAMLAINDMFVLSRENIASYFKEDVERYFVSSGIIFTPDVKLVGKSGYTHSVDFIVPRSKTYPERLIKTIGHLRKDQALNTIASFVDINSIRESAQKFVIFDDFESVGTVDSINALKNYNIEPLRWSQKDIFNEKFSLT